MKTRYRIFWYHDERRRVLSRPADDVDAEYRARAADLGFIECDATTYRAKATEYYIMDNLARRERRLS